MKIAVFGAGGLGREAACLIREIDASGAASWDFIGFYDDNPALKQTPQGKVLGNLQDLNALKEPLSLVIALGNPAALKSVRERLTNPLLSFPNLISPQARFHEPSSFSVGCGNIIQAGVDVSCNVSVGDFNMINFNVTLGHDVCLGCGNVCLTGARLSGCVCLGDGNLIGTNSVIYQGVKIASGTTVGAASFVIRDTRDGESYLGVPAKILRI